MTFNVGEDMLLLHIFPSRAPLSFAITLFRRPIDRVGEVIVWSARC